LPRNPDVISVAAAHTLDGLFRERVRRSPDAVAYRQFDAEAGAWQDTTWANMGACVGRWQEALLGEELRPGDRVAIMVSNRREWVCFDQAALGLGLYVVPLYTHDRGQNSAHILQDSGARFLFIEGEQQWHALEESREGLGGLASIVSLHTIEGANDPRLRRLEDWLPSGTGELRAGNARPEDLATIVYTSGTTGKPKGVMLSHSNILSNAWACLRLVPASSGDVFLSFLPLSHMLERTVGYYLPMMAGARVAFARSVSLLAEDLAAIRPTALISVPLIYERMHKVVLEKLEDRGRLVRWLFEAAVAVGWNAFEHRQGRRGWRPSHVLAPGLSRLVGAPLMERLGGRLRVAVTGGAPLPLATGRMFLGLGLPLIQGYGLTETSPVISLNSLEDNDPWSIGRPIDGIEMRIGADDNFEVRGPNVMLGYWDNDAATREILTDDGWLKTGDQVRIDDGRLYIVGRVKDILVLANGEKVPPDDVEKAITIDPWFYQALLIGDGRPYLSALVVLEAAAWKKAAANLGVPADPAEADRDEKARKAILARIDQCLHAFPGYARVKAVAIAVEPWTVENGLQTPTQKKRKKEIIELYAERIEQIYRGAPG
jgi:long-chain acyl-CoA synthetase